jgi:hypothetical protein
VAARRGRGRDCAPASLDRALLGGPSTSPLERSMRRLYLISVSVGVATLWLTQWVWTQGTGYLYNLAPDHYHLWYLPIENVLFAVAMVLPGFCAGWISKRRGILLGALTGLIGGISYTMVLYPFVHHGSADRISHFFASEEVLTAAFWSSQFGLALTCAAGGGTGELLRSNNRWRGP